MKFSEFIGVLPKGLDDLVQASAFPKEKVFYFTEKDSAEHLWIADFLPKENILTYSFLKQNKNLDKHTLKNILKYSDLTQILKNRKIKYLLFSNSYNLFLEKWSRANKIQIIVSPYKFKTKFENKIRFDAFLAKNQIPRPAGTVYNFSQNSEIFKTKMVLQKANSCGSEGTFFLNQKKEFLQLVQDKKIKKNENCLLRKYVEGESFGITVFVGAKTIATSAIRQQCFYPQDELCKKNFAGIQWVAGKNIPNLLAERIRTTFAKMGELLHREKFLGYANFDFIADSRHNLYLIECNPRFSASNPHLLQFPQLISNLRTEQIFVADFIQKQKYSDPQNYPFQNNNIFEGTNLQIKVPPHTVIQKDFRNGLYGFRKGKIVYLDADIRKLAFQGTEFIFHSNTTVGRSYPELMDTANVISNFPLFAQNGSLNSHCAQIVKTFTY